MENATYKYGNIHELKTWPVYFNAVINDVKTFEVRKADRKFKLGDILLLKEWNPETESYTGACCTRVITYVLPGGQFGIIPGFVVLGLKKW